MPWQWGEGMWEPSKALLPLCVYLCLSLSSFARGVWLLLSFLCLSSLPWLSFPLSSPLFPEASIQKKFSLVRALEANFIGILFPSPT